MESNLAESERDLVLRGQVDLPGDPDLVSAKLSTILKLQQALQAVPSTLHTQQVTHHFAPGVYCREWRSVIPYEITIGKRHRKETVNILAAGRVLVVNVADQRDRVIITAPHVWVSPPGSKRAVVTLEPCSWVTVHVTSETDLEKIEAEFIMGDDE